MYESNICKDNECFCLLQSYPSASIHIPSHLTIHTSPLPNQNLTDYINLTLANRLTNRIVAIHYLTPEIRPQIQHPQPRPSSAQLVPPSISPSEDPTHPSFYPHRSENMFLIVGLDGEVWAGVCWVVVWGGGGIGLDGGKGEGEDRTNGSIHI